jgi:GT2 family glycosyltransferase
VTGIVVITWNSAEVIGQCLDACLRLNDVEVLVVDNGSSDSTVENVRLRPGVRLIENRENRGFAGAANQGLHALRYPAVLLLNPDAMPAEGVAELAALASGPGVGAAGGRLMGPDGRAQTGFNVRAFPTATSLAFEILGVNRLLPKNSLNRAYRIELDPERETEVDQPAGAFLMINRAAWDAVGGFDEDFWPVWFEDVDFCFRLRQAGYRILYTPRTMAHHIGGHSAARLSWEQRQLFWYRSLMRYATKHFDRRGRLLVSAALMAGCLPRALFGVISGRSLHSASVYSKVFGIAVRGAG